LTTTAPPSKDGQAVHIEEMIDAMRTLWHEVRVVAPTLAQRLAPMGGSGQASGGRALRT